MMYFAGFLWGFVLLACFAGWGFSVRHVLHIDSRCEDSPWGEAIALGMAWIVSLGGFLNLLGWASRASVWLLLAAGLAGFVPATRRLGCYSGWNRSGRPPTSPIFYITLISCLTAYLACICLSESPYGDP